MLIEGMKFESSREAWGWALAKRRGRGARSPSYSDHVQSSHRDDDVKTTLWRLVYGYGGDSLGVELDSYDDNTLFAWARRECPLCGGYAPAEGESEHRCSSGPAVGRLFWTPGRLKRLHALEQQLRRRLRALELIPPPKPRQKLVEREGDLDLLRGSMPKAPIHALEDE